VEVVPEETDNGSGEAEAAKEWEEKKVRAI
jgi:hypothetical protein